MTSLSCKLTLSLHRLRRFQAQLALPCSVTHYLPLKTTCWICLLGSLAPKAVQCKFSPILCMLSLMPCSSPRTSQFSSAGNYITPLSCSSYGAALGYCQCNEPSLPYINNNGTVTQCLSSCEEDQCAPLLAVLQVECGSNTLAPLWATDSSYITCSGGNSPDSYTTTAIITTGTDSAPASLYQAFRYCNNSATMTYTLPKQVDGLYSLTLHFAEIQYDQVTDRVFDVYINSQLILAYLDVYSIAGENTAYDYTVELTVTGSVTVEFVPYYGGAPMISGIELQFLSSDIYIKAGGGIVGLQWLSDSSFYQCVDDILSGGEGESTGATIKNTDSVPEAVYQSYRSCFFPGYLVYHIPVSVSGIYNLTLYWAEISGWIPGERIFSVFVDGSLVLENVDVARKVGDNAAYHYSLLLTLNSGTLIVSFENLGFITPFISALSLTYVAAPPTTTTTSTTTTTVPPATTTLSPFISITPYTTTTTVLPAGTPICGGAAVILQLLTGQPNVDIVEGAPVQYAKTFAVSMDAGYYQVGPIIVYVVVTGDYLVSAYESVALPEYTPLLIVYDPPGGLSSAFYHSNKVSMTLSHNQHKKFTGYHIKSHEGGLIAGDVGECTGLLVVLCENVVKTENEIFAEQDAQSKSGSSSSSVRWGREACEVD